MEYPNAAKRREAGVCIKCEKVPVVKMHRCEECNRQYQVVNRKKMREFLGNKVRRMWSPENQAFITYDDREGYDQLRLRIAQEMAGGAVGMAVCEKYQLSWTRLAKICREHGVAMTRKPGSGLRVKTPERQELEERVLADARAGMTLKDLRIKYPGHEVRYICHKAGVVPAKAENFLTALAEAKRKQ
jgi:hypothetical protein